MSLVGSVLMFLRHQTIFIPAKKYILVIRFLERTIRLCIFQKGIFSILTFVSVTFVNNLLKRNLIRIYCFAYYVGHNNIYMDPTISTFANRVGSRVVIILFTKKKKKTVYSLKEENDPTKGYRFNGGAIFLFLK